ncbi:ATP-dependent nuclease [Conexibacter arvalis]|uniref:Energy-coupling factor transporter ATP-binding protein EcfA2 n=1 Tax=Conexibacter arvalis TaxID=912552 RepID=A0A840IBI6_9ACTN|nr:AAA family ATPase [Conexibacter arvalis]MBB4661428.1 energy-coupling factor transporter ATP-binding protein EcfA2 [Conexibacter arvalis]
MRLTDVHVTNFRSIVDGGRVETDAITCLVGKNESGKTSFLTALEQLNPADGRRSLDLVRDYPRWVLGEGEAELDAGRPPVVVEATYVLTDQELGFFAGRFGAGALTSDLRTRIAYDNSHVWVFNSDEAAAVKHLVERIGSPDELRAVTTLEGLRAAVATTPLEERLDNAQLGWSVKDDLRRSMVAFFSSYEPKYLYFGEYSLMPGRVSVPALIERREGGDLQREDQTFLALLDIANTPPESFTDDAGYERQKSRLEAAGLRITNELFEFWQQNRDSSIEFDKSAADATESGELAAGINLHVRAKGRRGVTVPIDQGSHGFRWFFSFLVYFTRIRDMVGDKPLVLLLDEPGSALHALAQADFLRVVEERLAPVAQVLYTTHSPFMVDANHLERVRIVTDDTTAGTVISNQVVRIDRDTLFPLQAALGYSIGQTLFVAPNALLVEGPSDMLYLQAWSRVLRESGRTSLDPRWVIVPVGGVSKVETFVRLYGANQLHTAVLLDGSTKHEEQVARLVETGQLSRDQIVSVASALDSGQAEADIEDLFPTDVYVDLVKAAYPNTQAAALTPEAVDGNGNPRLAKRVEATLKSWNFDGFDHLKPALQLNGNNGAFPRALLDRAERLFAALNACLDDAKPHTTGRRPARRPAQAR